MKNNNTAIKQTSHDSDLLNIKRYIPNEADIGRRVLCLYRVSTDKQVTYNENNEADIPMQRRECRRFLEHQGWVLVHEEREDGISGHKVRAEKRDSIQAIKELAAASKFDILLVFMFDRIGRIADETPFVVEWLAKSGVRVWSTKEGEQRFDSHTDKLTNYIRFWQADGESEKTSIRTKTGLGMLVEDGHYKGGSAPYGYELVKSGRLDKKKNEKKNLAVLEEEAVIVRKIFDLYVKHGYGVHKITNALTEECVKTRAGKNFHHSSINAMIRNITYTGILRSGETRSQVIEALRIVPQDIFDKAQDIMKKRNNDAADARTYPMNTESRCLLNGKVYCMDCGSRLVVGVNGKYMIVDGVRQKKLRYVCYGKTRKQTDCQGQTGYSVGRLDDVIDDIIRHIFENMQSIPKSEVVSSGLKALQEEQESRYKTAQRDYAKAADDLSDLKAEVLKSIRGDSKFSPDLLNELITQTERNLAEIFGAQEKAKQELDSCKHRIEEMQTKYDEVISWTELYDAADWTAKKMIVANLINRIEVGTDYQIHIDLNIDLSHFDIQLDFCSYGEKATA
jgi:DNA invertase Pin-like site-specific DNA recombinase